MKLQAKGLYRESLYDRKGWEDCEFSHGLTREECRELQKRWEAEEREDYGLVVTAYQIVEDDLVIVV